MKSVEMVKIFSAEPNPTNQSQKQSIFTYGKICLNEYNPVPEAKRSLSQYFNFYDSQHWHHLTGHRNPMYFHSEGAGKDQVIKILVDSKNHAFNGFITPENNSGSLAKTTADTLAFVQKQKLAKVLKQSKIRQLITPLLIVQKYF